MGMNKKLMIAIPVVAGVLALGTGVGVAYAKGNEPSTSYAPASGYTTAAVPNTSDTSSAVAYCGLGGLAGPLGLGAGGGLATPQVADLLGTTVADLRAQLDSGQTLADIAAAKNVSQDRLIQTVMAPFNDQMGLMLKYGYLTQDQINSMEQQMRDRLQTMMTAKLNPADEDGWGFMGNMMRGFYTATPQQPTTRVVPGTGFGGMMGGGFGGMMGRR